MKYIRPIRAGLFIFDSNDFSYKFNLFSNIISNLKDRNRDNINDDSYTLIDSIVYTIQQAIGIGFDLLGDPNSARKHVGNRFEELLRIIVSNLGISNRKIIFKIPYQTDEGDKFYSCETDIVISPFPEVLSDMQNLNLREIVVSSKTTSKDRMGKIFLDKILMERFFEHEVKIVGVFLNDVQRSTRKDGSQTISYTLVSGLFMVYTEFLTMLNGVYFIDPPPNTQKAPLNKHIASFSKFIIDDIWDMIG